MENSMSENLLNGGGRLSREEAKRAIDASKIAAGECYKEGCPVVGACVKRGMMRAAMPGLTGAEADQMIDEVRRVTNGCAGKPYEETQVVGYSGSIEAMAKVHCQSYAPEKSSSGFPDDNDDGANPSLVPVG